MFSTNENGELRSHEKRVVEYVESTIPKAVLEFGVQVMVMQVQCNTPGCVPIETVILVLFPPSEVELLVGLPESAQGKTFQTKILKPLADVTLENVLAALPPSFLGGARTLRTLGQQVRDVMFGHIAQLLPEEEDTTGRQWMVQFLQDSLQEYKKNQYGLPPEWGAPSSSSSSSQVNPEGETADTMETSLSRLGNITLPRPKDNDAVGTYAAASLVNSVTKLRQQDQAVNLLQGGGRSKSLSQLSQREHAPGIRQPGCPCCDPDSYSNVIDKLLSQV